MTVPRKQERKKLPGGESGIDWNCGLGGVGEGSKNRGGVQEFRRRSAKEGKRGRESRREE